MLSARGNVLFASLIAAAGTACAPSCATAEQPRAIESSPALDAVPLRPVARPDSTLGFVAPVKEVRGRRLSRAEILDRATGFADVLEASSWQGDMAGAADVLARAVGLNVRETGGLGHRSTAHLRGSSAAQLPIYLDGVLLNSPEGGEVDLASIDLSTLERVEIYRGTAPLTLGGGSLGGAIHLFSANGVTPLRAELGAGSHGTYEAELGGSTSVGPWIVAYRGRGYRTEGDWTYFSDGGTPYNPADDRRVERANNHARGVGGMVNAQRPLRGWTLRATGMVDTRRQGQPGLGYFQSRDAESGAATSQTRLSLHAPRRGSFPVRSFDVHHRWEKQTFTDADGTLTGTPTDRDDHLHAVGSTATGGRGARPSMRLEARFARWRSRDTAQLEGEGDPQTRWTLAAAWQPVWSLFEDQLRVSPGARVEWHRDDFHGTPAFGELAQGPRSRSETFAPTYQIGARWSVGPEVDLKADLGSYRRVPTLFELFGNRGSVMGRLDLRPENGTNRDVGLVWSRPLEGRRIEAVVFWNDVFDLITYEPVSAATTRPSNLGRAELRGLELDFDFGRFGVFGLTARFTRLSAIDRTEDRVARDKSLPGRPGYELRLEPRVHAGPTIWSASLTAVGENYLEKGERQRVPGRVLMGLGMSWKLSPVRLHARIRNLTDAEVYDIWQHPLPGRTFSVTVSRGIG